MKKTSNVTEVKVLSMEALAFISGGCNPLLDEVKIDGRFEPEHPCGKNPESDYPAPVHNPFHDIPEELYLPGVFIGTTV